MIKHGHLCGKKASKTYAAWKAMKSRCNNPKNKYYKHYGGRGIGYIPRWEQFENFLEDMGESPTGLTLERDNNNEGYSKDNCRWATQADQCRNRRVVHLITFNGKTQCIQEWEREIGLSHGAIRKRLQRGLSIEEAVNPVRSNPGSPKKSTSPGTSGNKVLWH